MPNTIEEGGTRHEKTNGKRRGERPVLYELVVRVGIVPTPRPWRSRLWDHLGVSLDPICLQSASNPAEAMALAPDVVVVDDCTSFLSADFIRRIRGRGVKVLGVFEVGPEDPEGWGRERLAELGVDAVVSGDTPASELVLVLRRLGGQRASVVQPRWARLANAFGTREPSRNLVWELGEE